MLDRTSIKYAIKRWLRRAGLEVSRHAAYASADERLLAVLRRLQIGLVLDIGANEGQYARHIRALGYRGRIVSFEPLERAHSALLEHARRDPLWQVAPRTAIGDRAGTLELHVSHNSVSSSGLKMLSSHVEAAPESAVVAIERVAVATLDEAAAALITGNEPLFVKIDVQGMEDKVIAGGTVVLRKASAAQIELSLAPLYEGQPLMSDIIRIIAGADFALADLHPGFVDPRDGRVLQVDGLFVREAHRG